MSGYEQRARDYLDRFTEEPTRDVYSPDAQAALEAIFESIAAEARAIPSTRRLVAREDLATVIEAAKREHEHMLHEVEVCDAGFRGNARDIEKRAAELDAAIDRLRAGEE